MENKQTAVEWLFEKITQNEEIRWRGTQYRELFEQAKALEKEQIMKANYDGFVEGIDVEDIDSEIMSHEQYYQETYGK